MYDVLFEDGYWWITKDGEILRDLGGFTDPVSPEIIVKEIKDEVSV